MKITILYDNFVYNRNLLADLGFSCLIELDDGITILFDTGSNGKILLSNMEKLRINPGIVDIVFISHAHFDHTGGLSTFLNENKDVVVYAPKTFRGIRGVKKVFYPEMPTIISDNVYSTGELENIEQSLVIKSDYDVILITGCSHPKMSLILETASQFGNIYALIGGIHSYNEFEMFRDIDLICPTHCTIHKAELQAYYPDKYLEGGAGQIISL